MQIGRRIYFDKQTGNIILSIGECSGSVVETTIEHDFEAYKPLNERNPETVGYIQLEYGQFAQDFAESNGYRVNPTTHEIEFSYPDPAQPEPEAPIYQEPLSKKVKELQEQLIESQQAIMELSTIIGGML